jgi:RimJ/RimL family protein N-acetyltransferase
MSAGWGGGLLFGERIRLRPIERDDLPRFVAWFADPEVRANLSLFLPLSRAQEERWYENVLVQPPEEQPFAVDARVEGESWHHIGAAGLQNLHWRTRSTEIGLVIGDRAFWRQGLGTEVTAVLVRFAFATLNLHRVALRVYEDNAPARRVYEKVGFVLEGRQRDGDFREGRYRDVLVYSILRHEWSDPSREQEPGATDA